LLGQNELRLDRFEFDDVDVSRRVQEPRNWMEGKRGNSRITW
jgi:hypothetical protein